MRALVYHGPGLKSWEEVPQPSIEADTDAIVHVDAVTICGTDLHILKGDVPAVTPGASSATKPSAPSRPSAAASSTSASATRSSSRASPPAVHAGSAARAATANARGAAAGSSATSSTAPKPSTCGCPSPTPRPTPRPPASPTRSCSCWPTSCPPGTRSACSTGRCRPGDVVAVVGAGPIGLAAIQSARLYSPSHIVAIDKVDSRLDAAKQFGADVVVNNDREDPAAVIGSLTGGLGADVAIEAVGVPATFELSAQLVRPGGHVANIGVHGEPATLHLEDLWIRDITITTGLVDTSSTPTLLKLAAAHQIEAQRFVTHHFTMDQFLDAYDVFSRAGDTGALKVVVHGEPLS